MPLHIPNNNYQLSIVHIQPSTLQQAVVTTGMLYTGANFGGEAGLVENGYRDSVMTIVGSGWRLERFDWRTASGVIRQRFDSTPGLLGGAGSPGAIAYLVKKVTTVPGRINKGRVFVPGVEEGVVDETGRVTAGRQAEVNNAFAAWKTAYEAANFDAVILHNVVPAPGVTSPPTIVDSWACQSLIGIQRRRIRGG